MNILITGSLGVVGTALTKELLSRGIRTVGCDLFHSNIESMWHSEPDKRWCEYARCDISEFKQIQRVIERLGPFDFVYHAAAEFGRWNGEDFYEQLWKTNAIGTKHIIRLQEQHGFKLIHFSSSEVYGDWSEDMSEDVMYLHEIKQLNDYAMTKWINEMQIQNSRIQHGTQSVVVRLFNTYGPGEYYSPYRSVVCRFVYSALKGMCWSVYRGHSRSSLFLGDCVRTLANIAGNFKPGEVYNIASPYDHTIKELSDLVIRMSGAAPNLAKILDEELLTTKNKRPVIAKAVKDLDHKITVGIEDGIKKTIEWMRSVYCK